MSNEEKVRSMDSTELCIFLNNILIDGLMVGLKLKHEITVFEGLPVKEWLEKHN